jgi:molybdopterin-containing oxidoreductase family iron-sulfur binding subunit
MTEKTTRRTFLATTGACAIGIGCGVPVLASLSGRDAPAPGEKRWTMVVDTAKCRERGDCRDCILACHREHNVPDLAKVQHEVKWVWKEPYEHAFVDQHNPWLDEAHRESPVLLMCNHCDNPPCVRVCPTQATWRREDGIVAMDMHRCIGCRYCTVACPYGSRSFNWKPPWPREKDGKPWPNGRPPNPSYPTRSKGVVEKCNFCAERLAEGKEPKCVEACPVGALTFGDVNDPHSEVRKILKERHTVRRNPGLGTLPHVFYIL